MVKGHNATRVYNGRNAPPRPDGTFNTIARYSRMRCLAFTLGFVVVAVALLELLPVLALVMTGALGVALMWLAFWPDGTYGRSDS